MADSDQTSLDEDARPLVIGLDPAVTILLMNTVNLWKEHRPIEASLLGQTSWDAAEDLADQGLGNWRDALSSIRQDIDSIKSTQLTQVSQTVIAELGRFVQDQTIRHVYQAVYETRAAPYLQLCAFALLPFSLQLRAGYQLSAATMDRLGYRLDSVTKWLAQGEARIAAGRITVTEADKILAAHLYQALAEWDFAPPDSLAGLLSRLECWARLPLGRSARGPEGVRLSVYLRSVLDVERPLSDLVDDLQSRLRLEVGHFHQAGLLVGTTCHAPIAESMGAAFERDDLSWVRWVEAALRQRALEKCLSHVGPPAQIVIAPKIIQPFIDEALHFRCQSDDFTDGPLDFLVMNGSRSERDSPGRRAGLALIVAHELCPGHGEHLRRIQLTPFAPLFDVTRSPIGLEGWAFHAEASILDLEELGPAAAEAVYFQRVRRFVAALRQIARAFKGSDFAQALVSELLAPLDDPVRQELLAIHHRQESQMLVYSLGLLETEAALANIAGTFGGHPNSPETVEMYLMWGPIAPHRVVDLVQEERRACTAQRSTTH